MAKYWKATRMSQNGNVSGIYLEEDDDGVAYQEKLVSGENIKTINGESILGAGGISTYAIRKYEDTVVAVEDWESDDTYEDFPFRASIEIAGVAITDFSQVVFRVADAMSGNYAPVSETYNGGVYIYASEVPEAAITIPSIVIM